MLAKTVHALVRCATENHGSSTLVTTSNRTGPRWWQWPTVLSLDAPAVVVTWQSLFGAIQGARPQWWHALVVGGSVWLAYSADRWLEARRSHPDVLVTPRHRFHAEHHTAIGRLWLAVLLGLLTLSFAKLTRRELTAGFILLAPTLAYVLSHQLIHRDRRWRVPKEVCVAGLISAGAAVFVAASPGIDGRRLAAATLEFALLALTNVLLISTWEAGVDAEQGQTSLALQFPRAAPAFRWFPYGLALVAIAAGPALGSPAVVNHCVAASAVLLAAIDHFQPRIGWQLARVLADAALLTPLLPLSKG